MTTTTAGTTPAPTMIRWGAVVAGAVIGIAVLILLTSLFVAIGGEAEAIANNLHWFGFISAIVGLFVAGLLAGWMSGVRGATSGLFHGLTTWGLILVAALAFPFPQTFGVLETFATPLPELGTGPLWAAFLSVVVGLVVAGLGGLIGGAMSRPASVSPPPPGYEEERRRPEDTRERRDVGAGRGAEQTREPYAETGPPRAARDDYARRGRRR